MAEIEVQKFREYEAQGLITGRPHPTHDLIIWNYTQKCQFEQAWDEVTMQARGLITRPDGTIVARPFKKFFNYEQHTEPLPLEPFKVTEKCDGSLGILYFIDGKPYIATRGSFTSEQALRANSILERYHDLPILTHYTYLFEIIFPENRIVVDYGETEDLILLAAIHTETGKEIDIHDPSYASMWTCPIVKRYDGITDIAALRELEEANKEGFVIRFESGLRLKVKFEDYKRLHRILTQCTARTIWEAMSNNISLDAIIENVPDEFFSWFKETRDNFNTQFYLIEGECQAILSRVKHLPTRKEQAALITQTRYPGVVFSMLDNKNYEAAIWKLLYPAASKPFRKDEE